MGRNLGWSPIENDCLSKAWLNVSQDSITGTGQTQQVFWDKVLQSFNSIRSEQSANSVERKASALKSRWDNIKRDVSKFCGLYSKVKAMKKSGWSEDMYRDQCLELWKRLKSSKEKAFEYLSCWVILKNSPKWMLSLSSSSSNAQKNPSTPHAATRTKVASSPAGLLTDVSQETDCEKESRPNEGNKLAKKRRKSQLAGEGRDDLLSQQVMLSREFVEATKKRVAIMEDQGNMSLFAIRPDSEETALFFKLRSAEILRNLQTVHAAGPTINIEPASIPMCIVDERSGSVTSPQESSSPEMPTCPFPESVTSPDLITNGAIIGQASIFDADGRVRD